MYGLNMIFGLNAIFNN